MGATTYYEYGFRYGSGSAPLTGAGNAYTNSPHQLTLDSEVTWWWSSGINGIGIGDITFATGPAQTNWEGTPYWGWTNAALPLKNLQRYELGDVLIADAELDSAPLLGVSYLINDIEYSGQSSPAVPGRKVFTLADGDVVEPIKEGYEFSPESFTYDEAQGLGVHVVFTAMLASGDRQVENPTPSDTDTGITLTPRLQWEVSGEGLKEGDNFDVYLKADDLDFGPENLLRNVTDLDVQVIAGLIYNTLYYWQVVPFSEEGDLLGDDAWSFTTLPFLPPAPSGGGNPTGLNNMITVKRLIVAADNKVFYET